MAEKGMKELRDEMAVGFFERWILHPPFIDDPNRNGKRILDETQVRQIAQTAFAIAEIFAAARYDADNRKTP